MRNIRILNYHRISNDCDDYNFTNVTESNFKAHIEYLRNNYDFVCLDDLLDDRLFFEDGDAVAITFDDGYYNVYKNAFPYLKQYNIPATCFISTENIDTEQENWTDLLVRAIFQSTSYKEEYTPQNGIFVGNWKTDSLDSRIKLYRTIREMLRISNRVERDAIIADICAWGEIPLVARESRRIMTSNQLKELDDNDNITIGAHTVSHPFLASLSCEEIIDEITDSKNKLESIVGHSIDYFAYPFGDFSDITTECLVKAGYKMAFTSGSKGVFCETDKMLIPRYSMRNYNSKEFECVMSRIFDKSSFQENNTNLGCYIGSLSEDISLITSNKKIIICGAGNIGQSLFRQIIEYVDESRIYAFEDQNREKQGHEIMNRMILDADTLEGRYNDFIFIVKGWYAKDKYRQLRGKGCKYIHVVG